MTFEYEWTRDDLRKVLIKKRIPFTVIVLIISMAFYYYLIRFGLKNEFFDNTKLIVGFIIYFILVWIILYLLNIFYIYRNLKRNDKRTNKAYGKYLIRMNDKQIESVFNNQKIVYKWIDISKVKIRKKYFFIRTKNDFIGLTFRKDMLKDDYQKILDYVKEKTSK